MTELPKTQLEIALEKSAACTSAGESSAASVEDVQAAIDELRENHPEGPPGKYALLINLDDMRVLQNLQPRGIPPLQSVLDDMELDFKLRRILYEMPVITSPYISSILTTATYDESPESPRENVRPPAEWWENVLAIAVVAVAVLIVLWFIA